MERTDDGFAPRYPWDEWFDGQTRKAVKGEDFKIAAANFRHTIKAAARRRGLDVRTRVDGDSVIFKTSRPGD